MTKPARHVVAADPHGEPNWEDAACTDPTVDAEWWFSQETERVGRKFENTKENLLARRICNQCDIQQQCLQFALNNDIKEGTWGGLSESEREKLRHEQRHRNRQRNKWGPRHG
jgi:WhiB family redox-sensing transcriptional regulator